MWQDAEADQGAATFSAAALFGKKIGFRLGETEVIASYFHQVLQGTSAIASEIQHQAQASNQETHVDGLVFYPSSIRAPSDH